MSILGAEQVQMVKRFIFENGRLLERQLFEYFFGNGAREACTLIIFPSFSRAWYHANDCVSHETVMFEARKSVAAIQEDGGLDAPYPELPHWRPIFTLDGLIQLKQLTQ